jgi:hypothetical protein
MNLGILLAETPAGDGNSIIMALNHHCSSLADIHPPPAGQTISNCRVSDRAAALNIPFKNYFKIVELCLQSIRLIPCNSRN